MCLHRQALADSFCALRVTVTFSLFSLASIRGIYEGESVSDKEQLIKFHGGPDISTALALA